jgi:diguanylate cyclase (GGDEF)-like protein
VKPQKRCDLDVPGLPILEHVFDGVVLLTHTPWRIVFANRTFASWLGRSSSEITGMTLAAAMGATAPSVGLEEQLTRARFHPELQLETMLPTAFGASGPRITLVKTFHLTLSDTPLFALVLRPLSHMVTGTPSQAPHVDPLTALPDRSFLLARLAALLESERVPDRDFAVLFLDLDNFKQINDRYGHLIGDQVLREVARRLQRCVRECDHVTRYGGDEFVVLLERVSGTAAIESVLGRIRAAVFDPIVVPEGRFDLSLSIGVARSAPHLRFPEDVLGEADRQMYAAKRSAAVGSSVT